MKEEEMKKAKDVYRSTTEQEGSLKVLMPEIVWQKMMGYVNACDYEINGFGYVTHLDDHTVRIEDVFILRQTVSVGSAVTEPDEVANHITQMIEQGKDTSSLRFQWHSHVHMQSYFSGTDTSTINEYANCDWMISLVVNKREEFAVRLDIYQPFRLTTPTQLKVFVAQDDAMAKACAQEVEEKVSARVYVSPTPWKYNLRKRQDIMEGEDFYEKSRRLRRPTRDIRSF
jgi:hypothetical protein